MVVVFTDLDGTLLDHRSYDFTAARPALERLRRLRVPLIYCTSKTRAETEYWRATTANLDPFVTENGGAVYIPQGYFPFQVPGGVERDGYQVVELGRPYPALVAALAQAEVASGCTVRPFHRIKAEEIAALSGLTLEQAELAKRREFDEPFEILAPERGSALLKEIEGLGFRWTRGGRFHHITGGNDKAAAVRFLIQLFQKLDPHVRTIALGDSLNDAGMLSAVDEPVIMPSPHAAWLLELMSRARLAPDAGPKGWAQAISEMIPK